MDIISTNRIYTDVNVDVFNFIDTFLAFIILQKETDLVSAGIFL